MLPQNPNLGSYLYGDFIPVNVTVEIERDSAIFLAFLIFLALAGALFLNKL